MALPVALGAALCAAAVWAGGLAPGAAQAQPPAMFNPVLEAQNFSITEQRQAIYDTPAYQAQLAADSAASTAQALAAEAADPGRFFTDDLCWNLGNGCAGDIRLNNWATNGYGLVRPVLFTARDGATLSGHVWATVAGPARRPGIVITNGSVQADEQMYWYAAQTLAKAGYVVLTFDPQGQGQSDTFGQAPDRDEGVPAQTDGRPFYDGTEDAIDFLLSTPRHPYAPVRSCRPARAMPPSRTRGSQAGLDAAYNPFWQLLDPREIGLVGHSYGAAGVSYIAQWDPRVKAVVALDNLGGPGPRCRGRARLGRGLDDRRAAVPRRSRRSHDGADHQARPRHLGRLRPAADAQHVASRSADQGAGVAGLHPVRRRQRRDRDPRRVASRLQLHPQPGLRGVAPRSRHHRLVHDRLV